MYVKSMITVNKLTRRLVGLWIGLLMLLMTEPAAAQHSHSHSVVVRSQNQQTMPIPLEQQQDVRVIPEGTLKMLPVPVFNVLGRVPVRAVEGLSRQSRNQRFVEVIKENKYLAIGVGILTVSMVAILATSSGGGSPSGALEVPAGPLPMPEGRPGS